MADRGSVMLGTFLSVMDATVVNVAMPHMMGSFGEDLLTITWVSTAYSIAEIIMVTMAAWWTTLLGRKRLFLFSMALFIFGSILAGTAILHQMILYRVMQGIGGGSLMPCSQAIARETFPPAEQGMAMAIYTWALCWRPHRPGGRRMAGRQLRLAVGVLHQRAVLHSRAADGQRVRARSALSEARRGACRLDRHHPADRGLTAVQVVLERGEEVDWFASNWIVADGGRAVGLVALVIWELASEPMINFRLFKNRPLTVGSGIGSAWLRALRLEFLLPQFTENLLTIRRIRPGWC